MALVELFIIEVDEAIMELLVIDEEDIMVAEEDIMVDVDEAGMTEDRLAIPPALRRVMFAQVMIDLFGKWMTMALSKTEELEPIEAVEMYWSW